MADIKKKAVQIILFFVLGVFSGFMAKYLDIVPADGIIGNLANIVGNIFSEIGIWIFIATIIAAWSRTPMAGAIHVFVYFVGMLISYYIFSIKIFNFFPIHYFIGWGLVAIASLPFSYIVWFSRKEGWVASLSAALPIGILASEGYSFLYTFSPYSGFNLFAAIILFFILPKNKSQYIKVFIFAMLISVLLSKSYLLSYIMGFLFRLVNFSNLKLDYIR
ncbi:DUF6518 family protein [Thermoanaerobacter sp. YS13]|uniref:DUF6518 family protein n=1 Tax=Thermoanaerobacter sp. YS13 TaxID=1511746 RepID=UPI000689E2A7|nr:DUF6518 family protein [Thermoanaerobacter sp. YS13]